MLYGPTRRMPCRRGSQIHFLVVVVVVFLVSRGRLLAPIEMSGPVACRLLERKKKYLRMYKYVACMHPIGLVCQTWAILIERQSINPAFYYQVFAIILGRLVNGVRLSSAAGVVKLFFRSLLLFSFFLFFWKKNQKILGMDIHAPSASRMDSKSDSAHLEGCFGKINVPSAGQRGLAICARPLKLMQILGRERLFSAMGARALNPQPKTPRPPPGLGPWAIMTSGTAFGGEDKVWKKKKLEKGKHTKRDRTPSLPVTFSPSLQSLAHVLTVLGGAMPREILVTGCIARCRPGQLDCASIDVITGVSRPHVTLDPG